jgi:hypothetical protein
VQEAVKGEEWGWVSLRGEDVNEQIEKCAKEVGVALPAGDAWRFRRSSLVRVQGTPGPPASPMSSVALAAPPSAGQRHVRAPDAFGTAQYAARHGSGGDNVDQAPRSLYDELRAARRTRAFGALLKMALPTSGEASVNAGVAGPAQHAAPMLFRKGAGAMAPRIIH